MKIKWITEDCEENTEIGLAVRDQEYDVSSTLGTQLIRQKFAVEIKKKETKKTDKGKK